VARDSFVAPALPEGTAKITYTSGSTGTPKGVCLSAEAMLRVAHELEAASRPAEPQRYLAVLPLGVLLENLGVYAALMAGACVLYPQQQLGMGGASQVDFKRLLGDCPQRCAEPDPRAATADGAGDRDRARADAGWPTALRGGRRRSGIAKPAGAGRGGRLAGVRRLWLVRMRLGGGAQPTGGRAPWQRGKPLPHVQVRIAEDGECWWLARPCWATWRGAR
jgi:hypothetical protein